MELELKLREAKRRSIILYFNKDKKHFYYYL